jgi:endogenous inhibitor of DNA gyrase (YacG/DUF329 family)
MQDLGRWADGSYAAPGEPIGVDNDESQKEEGKRQK